METCFPVTSCFWGRAMVPMHCPGLIVSLKALLSTQAEAVVRG